MIIVVIISFDQTANDSWKQTVFWEFELDKVSISLPALLKTESRRLKRQMTI